MVAPTRTPQARGVKCDLCKKILASATWLDQTRLAKTVEDAQSVLDLVTHHIKSGCPCIPKAIENLLVGSTHFEIHRLIAKYLDASVYKTQYECFIQGRQMIISEMAKNQSKNINDCSDNHSSSRFKIYTGNIDQKNSDRSKLQLKHLVRSIDYWQIALEDKTHPFNSALALRLGLTHHVIYACYLFKYHKMLDYQLISANLLLNLFRSIEGVTANAVMHAYYLLIRSLMDCNQYQLARQYLKQAVKISNYKDKIHYESILLTCVACELNLLLNNLDKDNEDEDTYTILDDLATLSVIQKEDKLQHYLARTYAMSTLIKFIHYYPARSDLCFEFYHTYRFMCAIIRRCYESSFELILGEKDTKHQVKPNNGQTNQILDHSWIKFAVCDFVFSTFDLLTNFYMRTGQPESLELLYNGLVLISHRNGSCYWQAKMASIGASLDLLCDKYEHSSAKIESMSRIINQASNQYVMNLLRIDQEVSMIALLDRRDETVIKEDVVLNLLQQLRSSHNSLCKLVSDIELYDCKSCTFNKLINNHEIHNNSKFLLLVDNLSLLSLKTLKMAVASKIRAEDYEGASGLMSLLADELRLNEHTRVLTYSNCLMMLETLLHFAGCHKSEQTLLEVASTSNLFMKAANGLDSIESKLSLLTISSNDTAVTSSRPPRSSKAKTKPSKTKPNIAASRFRCKRKGIYDVCKSAKSSFNDCQTLKVLDTIDAMKNFSSLTNEDIVLLYMRNSEPCPDYLLYRRAHELMFAFRLKRLESGGQDISADLLLYHFCEFNTANTMRYRWMMYEEQQVSPYDSTADKPDHDNHYVRMLRFANATTDTERVMKSFLKSIPDDYKLLQIKYIIDKKAQTEHLLAVRFGNVENCEEPVYIHAARTVFSNNFLEDRKSIDKLALPEQLSLKIEEAKKTLFYTNQRTKTEARQRIERDIEIILSDIENEWFSNLKFVLCLDNSGQIGLILDSNLEHVPFETLPIVRVNKQGIFRVPSLRLFSAIVTRHAVFKTALVKHLEASETAYVLDPASNLANTRKRFETKLRAQTSWVGTISCAPQVDQLDEWLKTKHTFLFIGHGAGTTYYNQLCKGRGLSAMSSVQPMQIMMGCSSGRLQAEGPRLESFGISWVFILKGSPAYVGLLWDVTDTDIDRFLDSLLYNWMGFHWEPRSNNIDKKAAASDGHKITRPITEAVAWARHVCQYKFLVGSSPVVYGLPMWIK